MHSIQELTEAVERLEKEVADLKAENAKLRATVVHEHHHHSHRHYEDATPVVRTPPVNPWPANPWWYPNFPNYPIVSGVVGPNATGDGLAVYMNGKRVD